MRTVVSIGLVIVVLAVAAYLILASAGGSRLDPPGSPGATAEPAPPEPDAHRSEVVQSPPPGSGVSPPATPGTSVEPKTARPEATSNPTPAPAIGIRATGSVRDSRTGRAIAGATVEVSGRAFTSRLKAVTDADGRYEIIGLLPRHRSILARAEGYDSRSLPLKGLGDEQEWIGIDFELRPQAVVTGQVLGPEGAPLAGVEVDSVILSFTPRTKRTPLAVTDREGRYRALISAGPYRAQRQLRLFGRKAGLAPGRSEPIRIRPGETVENVIIRLDRGGGVEGRVRRDDGRPFKSAHVNLMPNAPSSPIHLPALGQSRSKTDAEGRYAFTDVPAGTYRVIVWFGTLRETRRDVHVVKGQTTRDIDFAFETGRSIAGIVVNGEGEPLRMVSVQAAERASGERRGQRLAILTDDDGAFQVFKLTGGLYDLTVSGRGYKVETIHAVPPGAETLRVVLSKLFAVTGQVHLADGVAPCPEFILQTFSTYHEKAIPGRTVEVRDAEGKFRLRSELFSGRPPFSICAHTEDGLLSPRVEVRLESGFAPEPVHLVLAAGAVVRGVVQSETGQPLAGARVEIRGGDLRDRRNCRTGARGRFRLEGLPPGSYVLSASHPEWVGVYHEVRVQRGEEKRAVLTLLAEGGTLHVTVLDEQGAPIEDAYVSLSTADRGAVFDVTRYRKRFEEQSKTSPGSLGSWRDYYLSIISTDASGHLERRFLPAGRYEVSVHAGGYQPGRQTAQLPAGGQAAVQFVLKKAPNRKRPGSGDPGDGARPKAGRRPN